MVDDSSLEYWWWYLHFATARCFFTYFLCDLFSDDHRYEKFRAFCRSADFLWADEAFTATTIPEQSCMALLKRLLCLTKSHSNCLIIVPLPERTVSLSSACPLVAVARMKTSNCTLRFLVLSIRSERLRRIQTRLSVNARESAHTPKQTD